MLTWGRELGSNIGGKKYVNFQFHKMSVHKMSVILGLRRKPLSEQIDWWTEQPHPSFRVEQHNKYTC